jgi:hypothetical protein
VVRIEPPELQPVVVRVSTTAVRASQTPAARLALAFLGVALFCAANILFFARLAR